MRGFIMKYGMIQKVFWRAFQGTFEEALSSVLHEREPKRVMKEAHTEYKKILSDVDEFEKGDRFLFNILSAAMFSSVLLHLERTPDVEEAREYYRTAMNNNFFMRKAARKDESYTPKGRKKLKVDAERSQRCKNPYSWKFVVEDGATMNEYTATFYTCGICYLLTKLGLKEYISALCRYDYDMAALSDTEFQREYTLAGGGPYCDCHYKHQPSKKGK